MVSTWMYLNAVTVRNSKKTTDHTVWAGLEILRLDSLSWVQKTLFLMLLEGEGCIKLCVLLCFTDKVSLDFYKWLFLRGREGGRGVRKLNGDLCAENGKCGEFKFAEMYKWPFTWVKLRRTSGYYIWEFYSMVSSFLGFCVPFWYELFVRKIQPTEKCFLTIIAFLGKWITALLQFPHEYKQLGR